MGDVLRLRLRFRVCDGYRIRSQTQTEKELGRGSGVRHSLSGWQELGGRCLLPSLLFYFIYRLTELTGLTVASHQS